MALLVPRRLEAVVHGRLRDEPVVALQGPRTVGKSTLLAALAAALGRPILDFDDLATREAAAADPALFVAGAAPVCIDEYQHVPEILEAMKAELNRSLRPGRFLITGSTRYDSLPAAAIALTGRLHAMTVLPLAQSELAGVSGNLITSLFDQPRELVAANAHSPTTRAEYVERVHTGGMPIATARTGDARSRWFDDYVSQTLERDVTELRRIRQRSRLPRLLERLISQTGQVLNVAAAARESGLDPATSEDYLRLLEAVFLVTRLPAWGTTLRRRASASPKVHAIDSGVAAHLLRLTPSRLASLDPSAMTEFGHLLETFAVGEVLKQASWLDDVAGAGHWRTHDGDEVDLVVERYDGRVIAFEVKAAGRAGAEHLRSLRKLRDAVGDRFAAGALLYLGERGYTADDRLHVLPLDALWRPAP